MNTPVPVQRAEAADASGLLALRESTAAWLVGRGIRQWEPGEVTLAQILDQVRAGQWHLLRAGGRPVAALRLLWEDEPVWGPRPPVAAYVHGLMVDRGRAGNRLGVALLGWAADRARSAGRILLRLDCVEGNRALRRYYTSQGFQVVGRREFEGHWCSVTLFEKPVGEAPGPAPSPPGWRA